MQNSSTKWLISPHTMIASGAAFAMLAVIFGAFAAHALKSMLDTYSLAIFDTAARYQLAHAIALVLLGLVALTGQFTRRWLDFAAIAFLCGMLLFCGSLYLLAITGVKWLGAITPLGGLAFIAGWLALLIAALKKPHAK